MNLDDCHKILNTSDKNNINEIDNKIDVKFKMVKSNYNQEKLLNVFKPIKFKIIEYNSDLQKGERYREWSSCQLDSFTRVAGDHVFRNKREDRFKHRIYHQLVYFKERYGLNMCVGCGRCIKLCPTTIDFVDIINKMK